MTVVKIAPNNPVFDLPVIVGIEEGLFAGAGLDVSFSASYADRESCEGMRTPLLRPSTWGGKRRPLIGVWRDEACERTPSLMDRKERE